VSGVEGQSPAAGAKKQSGVGQQRAKGPGPKGGNFTQGRGRILKVYPNAENIKIKGLSSVTSSVIDAEKGQ